MRMTDDEIRAAYAKERARICKLSQGKKWETTLAKFDDACRAWLAKHYSRKTTFGPIDWLKAAYSVGL